MIIRYSDNIDHAADQRVWCGYEGETGDCRWYIGTIPAASAVLTRNGLSVAGASGSSSFGVLAARMVSSLYFNGVLDGQVASGGVGVPKPIWIGAVENNGNEADPKKWIDCKVQAYVLYGAGSAITADQIAAVSAAMAAL